MHRALFAEYIQKKQNSTKKRPLGIPTFTDKLVQEVLRIILRGSLRADILQLLTRLSSKQELPHRAKIFERVLRCVVVH